MRSQHLVKVCFFAVAKQGQDFQNMKRHVNLPEFFLEHCFDFLFSDLVLC